MISPSWRGLTRPSPPTSGRRWRLPPALVPPAAISGNDRTPRGRDAHRHRQHQAREASTSGYAATEQGYPPAVWTPNEVLVDDRGAYETAEPQAAGNATHRPASPSQEQSIARKDAAESNRRCGSNCGSRPRLYRCCVSDSFNSAISVLVLCDMKVSSTVFEQQPRISRRA